MLCCRNHYITRCAADTTTLHVVLKTPLHHTLCCRHHYTTRCAADTTTPLLQLQAKLKCKFLQNHCILYPYVPLYIVPIRSIVYCTHMFHCILYPYVPLYLGPIRSIAVIFCYIKCTIGSKSKVTVEVPTCRLNMTIYPIPCHRCFLLLWFRSLEM